MTEEDWAESCRELQNQVDALRARVAVVMFQDVPQDPPKYMCVECLGATRWEGAKTLPWASHVVMFQIMQGGAR